MARLDRALPRLALALVLAAGCGDQFTPTEPPLVVSDSCNGPGAVSDTFDDGVLSDAFQSHLYSELTVEERDGALVFTAPVAGGSGSRDSFYAVDLRNEFVEVEVPEPLGGFLESRASLTLYLEGGQAVSMTAREDDSAPGTTQLSFSISSDEGSTSDSAPYDPTSQRWWRISEADGVLSFQASPDRLAWTSYHEAPTPAFVSAGTISLGMSTTYDAAPGSTIVFDNLNPDGGTFCGIDQLREPFDAPLDVAWRLSESPDCTMAVTGGALEATVPTGGTGQCAFSTRHGYDLRESALTVEIAALPVGEAGVGADLTLTSGAGDELQMSYRGGTLDASSVIGSAQSSGSADIGMGASWWRIRENDGRVEFEVSSDGASFDSVHSVIVDDLPAAFLVSLRLYVNSGQAGPTSLVVGALN